MSEDAVVNFSVRLILLFSILFIISSTIVVIILAGLLVATLWLLVTTAIDIFLYFRFRQLSALDFDALAEAFGINVEADSLLKALFPNLQFQDDSGSPPVDWATGILFANAVSEEEEV